MSIANVKKRLISPTHPGEMLREDFMPDFGLNVSTLATLLGVSRQTANELVQCRRAITPLMALRLSHLFGNSSLFWLNAQNVYDLWHAERKYQREIDSVVLLKAA